MKRKYFFRGFYYLLGMLLLTLGIVLNTKSTADASPIVSVAFFLSQVTGLKFGDMTFLLYTAFVVVEIIIHLIRKEKKSAIMDIFQIPLSLVFSSFVNVFSDLIPTCSEVFGDNMVIKIVVLILAIMLMGTGAALSVDAKIIPNPGDEIVKAIAECIHKSTGFTKNIFDISCVCTTCILGLIIRGEIIGVGLGTILAMIGVGRCLAAFNYFVWDKIKGTAGL